MVSNVLVEAFHESVIREIFLSYNYKKLILSAASKDFARELVMIEVSYLMEMNDWLSGILEDNELEAGKKTGKSVFSKDRIKRLRTKLEESIAQLEALCSCL